MRCLPWDMNFRVPTNTTCRRWQSSIVDSPNIGSGRCLMLRRILPVAVFLLCSLSGRAQVGLLPKVSVFGGYSYANADFTGVDRFSMNGWEASASVRGNPFLGFKADFSGHYGTQNVLGT